MTFSSASDCSQLQDELLVRLKKKSAHTKIKVLKILKYLVERGHESFTKDLQRRTEEIRECSSFRGPPDPMHGEAFNQQVRASAEELMDTMFESREVTARVAAPSAAAASGIASQGMGGNYVESGTYSPSLGRKMVGFGSTPLQPEKEKLGDRIKRGVIGAASKTKEKAREVVHKYKEHLPESMQDKIDEKFPETRPGMMVSGAMGPRSIGGYGSSAGGYTGASSGGFQSGTNGGGSSNYSGPSGDSGRSGWARGGEASSSASAPPTQFVTDPAYVARIVGEISTPAGVRLAPPKDVLAGFVARCTSLDCHHVAEQLHVKLGAGESDKTRLRTMHVILALVKSDIPGIATCFASVVGRLQELVSTGNASTKAMANKIIGTIGSNTSAPPTPQHPSSATVGGGGGGGGLIDFGGGMIGELEIRADATASGGGSGAAGMFGGMQMGTTTTGTGAAAPASGGGGMFGGMQMGPTSGAAPAAAMSNDLLGLGSLLGPSTASANPAAVPSAAATGDLLGGLSLHQAAPAPGAALAAASIATLASTSAPPASSFSFIGNASVPAAAAPTPPQGSAFSFMQAPPVTGSTPPTALASSFSFMQPTAAPAVPASTTGMPMGMGMEGMGVGMGASSGLAGLNIGMSAAPATTTAAAATQDQSGGSAFSFVTTAKTDDPFSFISSEVAANKK